MKKSFSILLIVALIFTLCSCTSSKGSNEASDGETNEKVLSASEIFDQRLSNFVTKESVNASVLDTGLLAPAQDQSKLWGYINVLGEWVIEPKYITATCFSGGYAFVLDQYNEYCIIDKTGNTVLSAYNKLLINEVGYYSEDLFVIGLGTGVNQKYVYLDTSFSNAINARILGNKYIRSYSNYNYFGLATPFISGLAIVMRLKNSDINDKKGLETAYVINQSGEVVCSLPEGLDPDASGFDDQGNVIVKNTENKFGLCDNEGNLIVPCEYRRLLHLEGKLYLVCNDNGFWGFIDENGQKVIDYKYQKAYPFSEGLAAVFNGSSWGFINENGETVIDFMFDDVAALKYGNVESSNSSGAFAQGVAAVKRNNHWILIDKNCNPKYVLNIAEYESLTSCPYIAVKNGYVSYAVEGSSFDNFGVITTSGERVLSGGFLSIGHFE